MCISCENQIAVGCVKVCVYLGWKESKKERIKESGTGDRVQFSDTGCANLSGHL